MTDFVDPSREHFEAFKALDRTTPILMLNMLRFHEQAQYADDHPYSAERLTGRAAYQRYGEQSAPIFKRVGGTIVWRGVPEATLIGPLDETWDAIFIARYSNAAAFLEMVTDPAYQLAVVNRQAAVKTSRLIRMGEAEGGTAFD